ncbi:xanthine dehydrogenase family protein molybdopterin-binding subunit [Paraburkholderia sp. DHOC27]|uniref:xanthine dehydrogenase family protein molybdopterin-binding subunit n=1 Tax=Paraburkholderia sp. DHOC27 TaxID=2303330 RepID=UPI000E3D3333|nr:molybdopterin cofactor-binding domain-containing protein [Paraburkholderia sp. DHOC27]RFU49132.1 xanthine dehydrogenase family protein molybdopterin-binding subunit [Paraburkholderia sp. DHOC27]
MSRVRVESDDATIDLSRRSFLIAAAATGALFGFPQIAQAAAVLGAAPSDAAGSAGPMFEPTVWFSIDHQGIVTVNVPKAEMGQHIGTAVARILADELEADWNSVRVVGVDTDPKWGFMVTGASTSVWALYPTFSRAGAAGRITLIEEGAKLLGVSPSACTARASRVQAGSRSIGYGEIVQRGNVARRFSDEQLKALPIKSAGTRRLIGNPTTALDVPLKINGTAVYGIDVDVADMLYARPKMPPTRYGSKVISVDDTAARQIKGYKQSLVLDDPSGTVPGWVMVIAQSYYAAVRATELVKVQWQSGETSTVSEKDLFDHATALIADSSQGALLDTGGGDVDHGLAGAKGTLEQTYTTAGVLHFQLEPVNAVAFEKNGIFEIHTGNQAQDFILPVLAKALQVPRERIVMRTYLIGGGFGRRLNGDYAVPAALTAQMLKQPVKMVLTREDDTRLDSLRSPTLQRLKMGWDASGKIAAMEHVAVAGWPSLTVFPGNMKKGTNGASYDPFSISGADHWYDVGPLRVRAVNNDLAQKSFRPGWLRAVSPGWTNWALESFMDEVAHKQGVDPVALRLAHLNAAGRNAGAAPNAVGGALRQANVVRRVAARAGWGRALPPDTGLGLGSSFGQERSMPTWCACVAQVKVDRATGIVSVQKLWVEIDAGVIIDPDGALAQAQGGTLWGLSMALYEGTEFENGNVKDLNLTSYTPLRMGDVPDMDIAFVDSNEVPVGLGEPPTTVVAPAIGNAIFAAVGVRMRHLPIRAEAVKAMLDQQQAKGV